MNELPEVPVADSFPRPKKPLVQRKPRKRILPYRLIVQVSFALLNIYLGFRFYQFVQAARTTAEGSLPSRPPGVEGWLPISGLMGFIDWISQGTLNSVHPAATILFLTFAVITVFFRKAFCAWLCPVGALSDLLAKAGRMIFRRNFRLPRIVDYVFMSLKYLLLGFFLWAFYSMGTEGISAFIQSPYNQIADVKMLLFFVELGKVGAIVLMILTVGSIFVQGFWCRYFCPYGALLGFFSWLSPVKVRRNADTCIDCAKCDKICPSRLPVMSKPKIMSVECTGCMDCVLVCPVKDTLSMGTRQRELSPLKLGILVLMVFVLFYSSAQLLGLWNGAVTDDQYRYHINRLGSTEYGHPGM
jgi:polyferredoxin